MGLDLEGAGPSAAIAEGAGAPVDPLLVSSLATTVRACALSATDKWCSLILVADGFCGSEAAKRDVVTIQTCAVAKPGELVRINDHALCGHTDRFNFRDLLRRDLEPFVVGVGEIFVVADELTDCIVV